MGCRGHEGAPRERPRTVAPDRRLAERGRGRLRNLREPHSGHGRRRGDRQGGAGRSRDMARNRKVDPAPDAGPSLERASREIGRASCRERVCQYVEISVVAVELKKKKKKILQNN